MPIAMAVMPGLVTTYATAIYLQGIRRFTTRDGYMGINAAYHTPVKQYAAVNFSISAIDNALTQAWINQQEYDDTVAYIS